MSYQTTQPDPETIRLSLQIGRQLQAGASQADIVGFGGGAGAGKTEWLLKVCARHYDVKNYVAKIFRRTYPQIAGGGGMWDRTHEIYMPLGGKPNHSDLEYRFPEYSSSVGFSHLQHEKDKLSHQGKEYATIGIDELDQFTWSQVWYLYSRNRSTCGVRPRMFWTFNPNPDHPLKEFLRWWLDEKGQFPDLKKAGVIRWFVPSDSGRTLWHDTDKDEFNDFVRAKIKSDPHFKPKSFAYIPGSIYDNPALLARDPGYISRLMSLPYVERQRLLYGDWLTRPAAGLYFRRLWWQFAYRVPEIKRLCRAWDLAGSKNGDYTAGVLLGQSADGAYYILDVKHFKGTPNQVRQTVLATAEADARQWGRVTIRIPQDPGQAGVDQRDSYSKMLAGYRTVFVKPTGSKINRAEPFSSQVEAGNVYIVQGNDWIEPLITEAEMFPDGPNDDMIDAMSDAFNELAGRIITGGKNWSK